MDDPLVAWLVVSCLAVLAVGAVGGAVGIWFTYLDNKNAASLQDFGAGRARRFLPRGRRNAHHDRSEAPMS